MFFFSIISREMSRARFYTYMGNLPEFTKETLKTFQAIMVKKTEVFCVMSLIDIDSIQPVVIE